MRYWLFKTRDQRAQDRLAAAEVGAGECGSTNERDRERWIEAALAKVPAGWRILDAGAGELLFKKFCSHLDYVSQDFGQYDGKGDGIGLQTGTWSQTDLDIVSDITAIPERDESFGAVMCIEVLEHLQQPQQALRELVRLLKPGGYLIVTCPFCSLTHFAPYFFGTGYSRYFYEHWFGVYGLEIIDMQWNGNYFEYLAQELRRLPQMACDFADTELGVEDRTRIYQMIRTLGGLSSSDRGSKQILAYGLHVMARKKKSDEIGSGLK
ncbi:MAG: methyltransferase domain-containing protein [Planctomycetota bacterium]|nr:methyltransferase domain-containing protein [Planctomycetota bacterium]